MRRLHRQADDHRAGLVRLYRSAGRSTTNGNNIKAVRAYNASQVGVLIKGSSNGVSFNSVSGSPVGVQIGGNSNDVRSGTISGNGHRRRDRGHEQHALGLDGRAEHR